MTVERHMIVTVRGVVPARVVRLPRFAEVGAIVEVDGATMVVVAGGWLVPAEGRALMSGTSFAAARPSDSSWKVDAA